MKRILVVDDDVHIGNMLEEALAGEGYAVSRAYSGTETVMAVSLCKPDLVLLGLMLPGLSGEEVLPKLRGAAKIEITGMVITVDRMEKALGSEQSAVQQAYAEEGVRVYSIVTIEDIIAALEEGVIEGKEHVPAIRNYLAQYGAKY